MRRGAKNAKRGKVTVAAELAAARKSLRSEVSRRHQLEKTLAEAHEQQTATNQILQVISRSPTDIQPVFDAIAEHGRRVCNGLFGAVFHFDGTLIHLVASDNLPNEGLAITQRAFPRPPSGETLVARAILHRQVIHSVNVQTDPLSAPAAVAIARNFGLRAQVVVPMLQGSLPIGAISVARRDAQPFSEPEIALLQGFAAQAVIAIENVRLFTELQEKNRAVTEAHAQVTEALEQQTAMAEILRVISRSPTDLQPVFDAIVTSAVRLCGARTGYLYRIEDGVVHQVAYLHPSEAAHEAYRAAYPRSLDQVDPYGRGLFTETRTQHFPDVEAELGVSAGFHERARISGNRSLVGVPMLREGRVIGTLFVGRAGPDLSPRPFSDREIRLLEAFADQAVIAIENVRLFTELQEKNLALTRAHAQVTESLEQQTATAEILRVIASSPTDVGPVFAAILDSAVRLCGSETGLLWLYDGEAFRLVADRGAVRQFVEPRRRPHRPGRNTGLTRAVAERQPVHTVDMLADHAHAERDPERLETIEQLGARTGLWVPLLKEGVPIGVIGIWRRQVQAFSESQIQLLSTFADQAMIAIENVRLFQELEARNRDLVATSEILQVISRSPTNTQPVFETIIRSAVVLCDAVRGNVFRFDGRMLHHAAQHGMTQEALEETRRGFPRPPSRGSVSGRAILTRTVVHVDITKDPEYELSGFVRAGFRTLLAVPMLRDDEPVGTIVLSRAEDRPFSDRQIALLQTFADQAVIAVENVRLFKELQERTRELARSVDELIALGEVGQAVSSTLDLETVLTTIAARADQLSGTDGAAIYEFDETSDTFHIRVDQRLESKHLAMLRARPTPLGEGVVGRAGLAREPVQIPDILQDETYQGPLREVAGRAGIRALLAVPLLRENLLVGALVVRRRTPGRFPEETVTLLQTFATQSVLAIQNARLFREIADKSRLLEAASRHKSEFLANMSHELRTPLNAILGFSEVLAERMFGAVNEKQAEYLQDILSSGRHLLSLINDILDLSKVEAGRLELELGRFHLPTALDNALTLVRERATRHGITLTQTVGDHVGHIVADERKVKQILLNLLSNAVKFTPQGGRVGLTATAAEDGVTIAVRDTGIGIAPEDQATIFEEFRQVGRDDTRQEGTGLGLTLAKKFVELHGGQIWVESHVGQGSTFTFTLPVGSEWTSSRE
jgi:GAF domain-containing protein